MDRASRLLFAWGNPSRGDDALGPMLAQMIEAMALPDLECLNDFQLQVEHALDLEGRQRVLLVDACAEQGQGVSLRRIEPQRDLSYSTHSMSPQSLLQVLRDLQLKPPDNVALLAISGYQWELGESLSARAAANLGDAVALALDWLGECHEQ